MTSRIPHPQPRSLHHTNLVLFPVIIIGMVGEPRAQAHLLVYNLHHPIQPFHLPEAVFRKEDDCIDGRWQYMEAPATGELL